MGTISVWGVDHGEEIGKAYNKDWHAGATFGAIGTGLGAAGLYAGRRQLRSAGRMMSSSYGGARAGGAGRMKSAGTATGTTARAVGARLGRLRLR